MVKFLNPQARTAIPIQAYALGKDIRADGGKGITVALLANGFPDSELFLTKIEAALKARLPHISTKLWNKGNPGSSASEAMLTEISDSCQVAIAAYGH